MQYKITTLHNQGDTVFYNRAGSIAKTSIGRMVAHLREDGKTVVYCAVATGEKKYGKDVQDLIEECLLFKTPEEVGADIIRRFKENKPEIVTEVKI